MFAKLQSEVRRPAVAGAFYPSGARELKRTVEALLSQATERRELSGLCGLVAPHAGYVYSGPIAGVAFSLLAHSNDAPNRILLIGPPHYVPVRGIVAPSSSAFTTPLGDVAVDVGAVESLRDAGLVTIDDTPHAPEHALEVELPFLQRVLEDFTIVPLLVDAASPEQVATGHRDGAWQANSARREHRPLPLPRLRNCGAARPCHGRDNRAARLHHPWPE